MTFSIVWSDNALKQLRKLDNFVAKRIVLAVESAKESPYRHVKKVIGDQSFRLRIGDYRVLIDINNQQMQILALKIGHRGTVYDR